MLSCFYLGVPADLAASVVMFNDIQHLPEDFRDLLHQEGVWKGVIVHSVAFFLLMLAEPILHPAAVTAASGGGELEQIPAAVAGRRLRKSSLVVLNVFHSATNLIE